MNKDISLKELCKLAEEQFSKDWYPKELPNGMREVAKEVFTNKNGMERFDKSIRKFLKTKKENHLLAEKYSAPRYLTLAEAKEIDPRFNERLGKIYMNVDGDIFVEHPYPGHSVQSYGTLFSHHTIIDGEEIKGDLSAYWFGEK